MARRVSAVEINYERIGRHLMHPTAREILQLVVLADGPVSPKALAGELEMPIGDVAYHVRGLAGAPAGLYVELPLLRLAATRPVRGSTEHFYVPTEDALRR